jgi:hypothetical protein
MISLLFALADQFEFASFSRDLSSFHVAEAAMLALDRFASVHQRYHWLIA